MFDKKKFKAAVLYADKTYQNVADALDMHINTLYRRIQTGEFIRSEINTLINFLHLDTADDIFLSTKLRIRKLKGEQ